MTIKDGIYLIVILILVVYGFFNVGSVSEARQKEGAAKATVKRLGAELDSLYQVVEISTAAIERADAIILGYKAEVVRAQARTRQIQKRYDSLHFKPFTSDSARYRALRNLYPNERF